MFVCELMAGGFVWRCIPLDSELVKRFLANRAEEEEEDFPLAGLGAWRAGFVLVE